jgi:hypothetical protein
VKRPSLAARLTLACTAVVGGVLGSAYVSEEHLAKAEAEAERLSERSILAIELAADLETLMHHA